MRWIIGALAALLLLMLLFAPSRPVIYSLKVINESSQVIDSVSLIDSAVVEVTSIEQLASGDQVELAAVLKPEGLLRVQVVQGLNRLDGIVEDDVSRLQRHQRRLTIRDGNRLLFSEVD